MTTIQQLKKWFTTNRPMLASQGVTLIEAEYSGSGDSGQCDGISVTMADEKAPTYRLSSKIDTLIREAIKEVTEGTGYEDDEGGGGKLLLNVVTGKILHTSFVYELKAHHNPDMTL